MFVLKSPKITQSQISQLFQYQLKEPGIEKYLDLSDSDYTYERLKELTERQYKFLNRLYIDKKYKEIGRILLENDLKPSPEYVDYLNERNN